jgi:hypothetical protein
MSGRLNKGKTAGISPFFAFQDIITSAMAVVITIVMLLALDMGDPAQSGGAGAARSELEEELSKLLDELARINALLKEAQEKRSTLTNDPELLKGETSALRAELENLKVHVKQETQLLAKIESGDTSKTLELELEKLAALSAAATQRLTQIKNEVEKSATALKEEEDELRKKEAQLAAEQAQKNNIKLIPERAQTSKEAVVVIVSENELLVQKLGHSEKKALRGGNLPEELGNTLKEFSKLDQYLVFFYKPSGTRHFKSINKLASSKGFEIGYDTLPEDADITLGSVR